MIVEIGLYIVTFFVIDVLAWGTAGYLLFRILGVSEEKSYYDFGFVCLAYLSFDYWTNHIWEEMDICIKNPEILELFDGDESWLTQFGWFDVVWGVAIVFVGYALGRRLWRRYLSGLEKA